MLLRNLLGVGEAADFMAAVPKLYMGVGDGRDVTKTRRGLQLCQLAVLTHKAAVCSCTLQSIEASPSR